MSTISFLKQSEAPLNRPGVSDDFLTKAGVRRVTAAEANVLCGLDAGGVWLPYISHTGKPVLCDNGSEFGRLRLDAPREDRKYHQRAGSKPRTFVPPNMATFTATEDMVVVEGEFKCLALAEAGIAAVGVGGVSSCFTEGQLVPGLREIVHEWPTIKRVLFLGDADTSLIFAFSREAVKLAQALPAHISVALPRIGLDGPGKGIDDCRKALGTGFPAYWEKLVAKAEPVSRNDAAEQLAVQLLKRETPNALRHAAGLST